MTEAVIVSRTGVASPAWVEEATQDGLVCSWKSACGRGKQVLRSIYGVRNSYCMPDGHVLSVLEQNPPTLLTTPFPLVLPYPFSTLLLLSSPIFCKMTTINAHFVPFTVSNMKQLWTDLMLNNCGNYYFTINRPCLDPYITHITPPPVVTIGTPEDDGVEDDEDDMTILVMVDEHDENDPNSSGEDQW